jgi:hypothetical protein
MAKKYRLPLSLKVGLRQKCPISHAVTVCDTVTFHQLLRMGHGQSEIICKHISIQTYFKVKFVSSKALIFN